MIDDDITYMRLKNRAGHMTKESGKLNLVLFSITSGRMGAHSTVMYKRLAYLLSIKRDIQYHLSFLLLLSAIMCLRGARSQHHCESINLATIEGKMPSVEV